MTHMCIHVYRQIYVMRCPKVGCDTALPGSLYIYVVRGHSEHCLCNAGTCLHPTMSLEEEECEEEYEEEGIIFPWDKESIYISIGDNCWEFAQV